MTPKTRQELERTLDDLEDATDAEVDPATFYESFVGPSDETPQVPDDVDSETVTAAYTDLVAAASALGREGDR
jgi:uncharacterized protein YciU (UPF0263 family)